MIERGHELERRTRNIAAGGIVDCHDRRFGNRQSRLVSPFAVDCYRAAQDGIARARARRAKSAGDEGKIEALSVRLSGHGAAFGLLQANAQGVTPRPAPASVDHLHEGGAAMHQKWPIVEQRTQTAQSQVGEGIGVGSTRQRIPDCDRNGHGGKP